MIKTKNITAMTCKKIFALTLFGSIMISQLAGQEYTRKITKAYRVNNSTTIDIYNKYGKVHIVTWDQDSVRFDIDLRIKANSDAKVNKLKNNIDFDFTGTEYYVIAKTRIGNNSNAIFSDLADLAGSLMQSDNKVNIDYLVMMPKHINLKIENKFGDVYIDDLDGNVNLTLSNGELKANDLKGNTVINLNSGDGVVNFIKDGNVSISYSNFHVKNTDKLTMDSRSSVINIDKADFLKLISRRDKYYLPEITDLYGESYFTDFTIHQLSDELNYSLKYGNLSIENITKGFSFIQVNSEYTDIDLVFDRGVAYDIDITHHSDVILNYPRQISNLQTKVINEDDKQNLTYGKIGSGATTSKVKINAPKKCTINIIHK